MVVCSLTSEDRNTRKNAIGKVHECLRTAAETEPKPVRRLQAPKNPVALRAEAGLKSQQRAFTLKAGDVVLFDSRLFHAGGANVSSDERRSLLVASVVRGCGGDELPSGSTYSLLPSVAEQAVTLGDLRL